MVCIPRVVVLIVSLLFATATWANPLLRRSVPEPLKAWIDWTLWQYPDASCSYDYNGSKSKTCVWPSSVAFDLTQSSGGFTQIWHVEGESFVRLPGDRDHWPLEVTVNGGPGLVLDRSGEPHLLLEPGHYVIRGRFIWDRMPHSLPLSERTGIISLRLDGEEQESPRLINGQLFIKSGQEGHEGDPNADSLDVRVYRRVIDEIPLRVLTRFELTVAGNLREETLPSWNISRMIPLSIESPLAVRFDRNENLHVQVRPGKWFIDVQSRSVEPIQKLTRPPVKDPLPKNEIWVFEGRDHLRLVAVDGLTTLDSSQTMLPEEWRSFPAYSMPEGATMELKVKRRGMPEPEGDRLTLHRTFWLDFDGRGYTVKDVFSGSLNRTWRLELQPPAELGRAQVQGVDQLITAGPEGLAGVELVQGDLSLEADSRLEKRGDLLAVGWNVSPQSMQATLHYPPGWRLVAVIGADTASMTWLKQWTLFNLFLLLLVTIGVMRLKGWGAGILAFIALLLTIPESGAPQYLWIVVLLGSALVRLVPEGRFRRLLMPTWIGTALIMVVTVVLFSISQIRQAVYPILEHPHLILGEQDWESSVEAVPTGHDVLAEDDATTNADIQQEAEDSLKKVTQELQRGKPRFKSQASNKASSYHFRDPARSRANLMQNDPQANIQTGPGQPRWTWHTSDMHWSGPVKEDQTLYFLLLPPVLNKILAFARVILLFALLAAIFNRGKSWLPQFRGVRRHTAPLTLLAFIGAGFMTTPKARADVIPSAELLQELGRRLTESPGCLPYCASVERLHVHVEGDMLTARLFIDSGATVAIPLPGDANHWLPSQVLINDQEALAIQRKNENLWVVVEKGRHQILISGPVKGRRIIELPLPLRPHRVTVGGKGWQLEGAQDHGRPDGSITLVRKDEPQGNGDSKPTFHDKGGDELFIPSFVRVERTFSLGLEWLVSTIVTRVSGHGSAAKVRLPLLPGEQITSANVRAVGGYATVHLAPGENQVSWDSTLAPTEELELVASNDSTWIETWSVVISPIWHLEYDGIPPVNLLGSGHQRQPTWRPWPGESVKLVVTRPPAVQGETLTLERSVLTIQPGLRSSESHLQMDLLTSLGEDYEFHLPDGADFQSVSINGKPASIRPVDGKITVSLQPGRQSLNIAWRQDEGVVPWYATPAVHVGKSGVNGSLRLLMPPERWILWVHGDGAGPAILFWSQLLVLLLASLALGRVPLTPIKSHQWFLLGLGLVQAGILTLVIVAGFFLAVGYRGQKPNLAREWKFNLRQLGLWGFGLTALVSILGALEQGLFGSPDMQIVGNGSHAGQLHWFVDRTGPRLLQARVLSVPIVVYQVTMLLWALWLAFAMTGWSKWIWQSMGANGFWKTVPWRKPKRNTLETAPANQRPHQNQDEALKADQQREGEAEGTIEKE